MADLPVGDIIKNITDDVKLLVQDQIELAKAELIPAAKNGGTGAGLFGAAGYFALSATILLYFAAALASLQQAGTVVSILDRRRCAALIAAILAGIGYLFVRRVRGPERTIAQANQSVSEVEARTARSPRLTLRDRGHGRRDQSDHLSIVAVRSTRAR